MFSTSRRATHSTLLVLAFAASTPAVLSAQNVDPARDGSRFVWGENVGWINLAPSSAGGMTVSDSAVAGLAWGENIGWINLNPSFGGVVNDGTGRLSGLAW